MEYFTGNTYTSLINQTDIYRENVIDNNLYFYFFSLASLTLTALAS